jgi:hypothetical protein
MMELVLTGLVAVGVPMWLAIEEMVQRRRAASRPEPATRTEESKPESRRAAAVAVVSLSRKPARAGYAG